MKVRIIAIPALLVGLAGCQTLNDIGIKEIGVVDGRTQYQTTCEHPADQPTDVKSCRRSAEIKCQGNFKETGVTPLGLDQRTSTFVNGPSRITTRYFVRRYAMSFVCVS